MELRLRRCRTRIAAASVTAASLVGQIYALDYALTLCTVLQLEGRILDSSGEEMARYALSSAFKPGYAKCWHSAEQHFADLQEVPIDGTLIFLTSSMGINSERKRQDAKFCTNTPSLLSP